MLWLYHVRQADIGSSEIKFINSNDRDLSGNGITCNRLDDYTTAMPVSLSKTLLRTTPTNPRSCRGRRGGRRRGRGCGQKSV